MSDHEARIAALEDAVAQLQRELARRRGSMTQMRRCPACGSGSLFHFTQVQERQHGGRLSELALHHDRGLFFTDEIAPLEAFACRSCRLVEWHARTLDNVIADGNEVIALEAGPEAPAPKMTPYR
jgi:hypothetical protein